MTNKTTNILVAVLLTAMFILALTSMAQESLTMDELAHLPAGYSYLTQRDMRLNPEHPPLMKDLAGFPLLFIKGINFPSDIKSWTTDVNGQWDFGNNFLFKSGNPAGQMIFWGRFPMILILILLGFYVFLWARQLFGNKIGLLALFLFAFSPTLLAHGRLVTTDVAAATGAFISTFYFVKYLQNSSKKNLIIAGVVLGLAELMKFSLVLLLPFFGLLIIALAITKSAKFKEFLKIFWHYLLRYILILFICGIVIWIFYFYHTAGYPPERQVSDTQFNLNSTSVKSAADLVVWMADKPILRPCAQYLMGLFMVLQRASGGNTGYFMGEISAGGWKTYFPTVYLLKEPLSFHILLLLAILLSLWRIIFKNKSWKTPVKSFGNWLKTHFAEFAMLLFIAIYWATSLRSNLNIGVRHLSPVFPFTILLVAKITAGWLKKPNLKIKTAALAVLFIWQLVSVLAVYPHFITYFNELAGGPSNGYKVVVDSNYDWGQDMKNLAKWIEQNNVDKIYLDYFGGSDTTYYLGNKFIQWHGDQKPSDLPKGSYLAVSATLLQGGRGKPAPGFDQPTGYYLWLNNYTPVARIGNSIFVYQVK